MEGQLPGLAPCEVTQALQSEGSACGLTVCCLCLEILNFFNKKPSFSIALDTANYADSSKCMLVKTRGVTLRVLTPNSHNGELMSAETG